MKISTSSTNDLHSSKFLGKALKVLNILDHTQEFPDVETALEEPDGLLAVGGCLSPKRLEKAYRHGIFPWYNENEPILWWSPNPRLILKPEKLIISRSLRKVIRKEKFQMSFDVAFEDVLDACGGRRASTQGTWITQEMKNAYLKLHSLGLVHSVECWYRQELVGGLYGVAIGRVFFGESMFYKYSNASKVAFVSLVEMLLSWGYVLIDCQMQTQHLINFGAENMPRNEFVQILTQNCDLAPSATAWKPFHLGSGSNTN